jgi:hypothetical protein
MTLLSVLTLRIAGPKFRAMAGSSASQILALLAFGSRQIVGHGDPQLLQLQSVG